MAFKHFQRTSLVISYILKGSSKSPASIKHRFTKKKCGHSFHRNALDIWQIVKLFHPIALFTANDGWICQFKTNIEIGGSRWKTLKRTIRKWNVKGRNLTKMYQFSRLFGKWRNLCFKVCCLLNVTYFKAQSMLYRKSQVYVARAVIQDHQGQFPLRHCNRSVL